VSMPSRWDQAPQEQAGYEWQAAELARVEAKARSGGSFFGEVLAAHSGSPSPAEMIGRGVTPASGG
jgi:hypothetical protein